MTCGRRGEIKKVTKDMRSQFGRQERSLGSLFGWLETTHVHCIESKELLPPEAAVPKKGPVY